jgi:uncharacterized membrane protein YhhN
MCLTLQLAPLVTHFEKIPDLSFLVLAYVAAASYMHMHASETWNIADISQDGRVGLLRFLQSDTMLVLSGNALT